MHLSSYYFVTFSQCYVWKSDGPNAAVLLNIRGFFAHFKKPWEFQSFIDGYQVFILYYIILLFPQHNISNAEYKERLIIIYKYKYNFGLAVVGG